MNMITRNMHDDITHWPVSGTDGFGGFAYGSPVLRKGRWEEKAELFMTLENEEEVSSAIAYMSEATAVGDYLAEGDHVTVAVADPGTLAPGLAFRIRNRNRSTNLASVLQLWKVFL